MEGAINGPAEEVPEEAPAAPVELRVPAEPRAEERRVHALTLPPYQAWCGHCARGRARDNRHITIAHEGLPVIECDYGFLKSAEGAPLITVLVASDTVYMHVVAIPLEYKGSQDSYAAR